MRIDIQSNSCIILDVGPCLRQELQNATPPPSDLHLNLCTCTPSDEIARKLQLGPDPSNFKIRAPLGSGGLCGSTRLRGLRPCEINFARVTLGPSAHTGQKVRDKYLPRKKGAHSSKVLLHPAFSTVDHFGY